MLHAALHDTIIRTKHQDREVVEMEGYFVLRSLCLSAPAACIICAWTLWRSNGSSLCLTCVQPEPDHVQSKSSNVRSIEFPVLRRQSPLVPAKMEEHIFLLCLETQPPVVTQRTTLRVKYFNYPLSQGWPDPPREAPISSMTFQRSALGFQVIPSRPPNTRSQNVAVVREIAHFIPLRNSPSGIRI